MARKEGKYRESRHSFCEWSSVSFGHYNQGGLICENCNFHRTVNIKSPGDRDNSRKEILKDNKVERDFNCPQCGSKENWYYLPPIARVPRKTASNKVWNTFWKDLKNRRFNHPESGCI